VPARKANKTSAGLKDSLVIVESPAKARTLTKLLGKGYNLKATLGHIRDLPKSQLGVDTEKDFTPKYVVVRKRTKVINELKKLARLAKTIYLATDPDREGEAIAWHLKELTKQNEKEYKRVVFHEITKEAIDSAFKKTRPINMELVNAQQARRILDRLVGYKLSPLLWRKVRRGLSAGRVQSVAVRIIVEREREIEKFIPEEYWVIEAELSKIEAAKTPPFRALLVGVLGGKKLEIHSQKEAAEVKGKLFESRYRVHKIKSKKVNRRPPPPFITSTLQQEAWRRLRFSAKRTMAVAQQLYEGLPVGDEGSVGLITYMRTDSTRVARQAVKETRDFIAQKYGNDYLPPHARSFNVQAKGAQEAHEAIRPTKIWRQPSLIKPFLNNEQLKLYKLIWERMVASQMAAAVFSSVTVDIEARHPLLKERYLLRSSSLKNIFPGFKVLYSEAGNNDDEKKGKILPLLEEKEELKLNDVFTEQRFTQPPPRFTEATLIKTLEQLGIGRPSTYAPIISTILDRDYVVKTNGSFKPTELGMVVNDLLVEHFEKIVNIEFTATMEDELDKIANEGLNWVRVVREFYNPFESDLAEASNVMKKVELAPEQVAETCPNCGKQLIVKTGRFGKFLACPGYPECKFTRSFSLKTGASCPECGSELVEKRSRKGKKFYGCSDYPNCSFATNMKPLAKPCPQCGSLLTEYRGKWEKCIKCQYKARLEHKD